MNADNCCRKSSKRPLAAIDATGADAAGLARVQQQIADLKTSLPGTIVRTVTPAKKMRAL